MAQGDADTKDESEETVPNPFSQLTDQELEEYKKEVERKKLELEGKEPVLQALPGGGEGRAWGSPEREQSNRQPWNPGLSPAGPRLNLASGFIFNPHLFLFLLIISSTRSARPITK